MCGRYIQVSSIEVLEKKFNVTASDRFREEYRKNYNIAPGDLAPVITSEHPEKLDLFQFGLTPFWAKKRMYLFNARSEGDQNKEDDPKYTGGMGIIYKPAFRKLIRSQRCLVPANCFIEGTTKERLNKPYVVYLRESRLFSFAGIWDRWADPETGEIVDSFSIITTTANELIRRIPHHRSPVILRESQYNLWLNPETWLAKVTSCLSPYPSESMNAYPVNNKVKNRRNNGSEVIEPVDERITEEFDIGVTKDIELLGMGRASVKDKREARNQALEFAKNLKGGTII